MGNYVALNGFAETTKPMNSSTRWSRVKGDAGSRQCECLLISTPAPPIYALLFEHSLGNVRVYFQSSSN